MKHRAITLLILCQSIAALAQHEVIRLPLRVHLVTGVEMVRESQVSGAAPARTVMNMPVKEQDMRDGMKQVNEIWAPAGIRWETETTNGGGGINTEQAGGKKLSNEKLLELAARKQAMTGPRLAAAKS